MLAAEKGEPMDWLTFISAMAGHLTWPVVAVGILWFPFRNRDTISGKIGFLGVSKSVDDRIEAAVQRALHVG